MGVVERHPAGQARHRRLRLDRGNQHQHRGYRVSAEVTTVTDEIFGMPLTRAAAERAMREAEAVQRLAANPRFAAWRDGWRVEMRSLQATLRTASSEDLAGLQLRGRLSHIVEDILADIELMARQGRARIAQDDKVRPQMPIVKLSPQERQNRIQAGRDVQDMLDEQGWPVVMQRVAERVRVHLLALETCSAEQRTYHQLAVQRLTAPINECQAIVREGLVAQASDVGTHGEQ